MSAEAHDAGDDDKGRRTITMASNAAAHGAHDAHDAHEHHPTGWRRFVYSTNTRYIGTMYLVFALVPGVIGGLLSIGIRLELQNPGIQFFPTPHEYNVFVTGQRLIALSQACLDVVSFPD
jgi:cytochrome c oxidase subunit 1